jgi:hypothetical protein
MRCRGILPYPLHKIFEAIQDGHAALMNTPVNNPTDDEIRRWVLEHVLFRPLTTQDVLERCTKSFDNMHASVPQDNWVRLANKEILADMRRVQIHPAFIGDYRRFVVLDSSGDVARYNFLDGVGWWFYPA